MEMSLRKDAVAGQFYPASKNEIEKMFNHYNEIIDESIKDKKVLDIVPRAIIVPHAGYVYSAFTANVAFRLLKNSHAKRVVVIGPSHRVYLDGVSVAEYDSYETPLGDLPIDTKLADELIEKFGMHFQADAHSEHSTEVQMPFVKTYLPNASVIEMVYGQEDPKHLAQVIEYLLEDKDTVIVISTDLSHYYDIEKANRLDSICLEAVATLSPNELHQGCEACGKIGIEAMLIAAKDKGLKSTLLDYRTSADASRDKTQVVGYMSAAFSE
jgi:AmmeMemoRadiSam system protein B